MKNIYVLIFSVFVMMIGSSCFFDSAKDNPNDPENKSQWTEQSGSGSRDWDCITSSADGTRLAAAEFAGYIYRSGDSGVTWAVCVDPGVEDWSSITSSSDGQYLAVCAANRGYIYTSDDYGDSWTQQAAPAGVSNWKSITSSSDGQKLAGIVTWVDPVDSDNTNPRIYTSANYGVTWTSQWEGNENDAYANCITSSSSGQKLTAVVARDIYTSIDYGDTWIARTSLSNRDLRSIASSSDGTKVAVTEYDGYISTSTDGGVTWTERFSSGLRSWTSIASSSDGTRLAACDYEGFIYTSTDSGATWEKQVNSGARNWYGITMSSDGALIAAIDGGPDTGGGGYIYTSVQE